MNPVAIKLVPKDQEKHYAETLRSADQIYIKDHMPPIESIHINVDGVQHYFKNTIIDLFNKYNIDYQNKKFISDHYITFEDFENFNLDCENMYFIKYFIFPFSRQTSNWQLSFDHKIDKKLTFMSNKPREHRLLCSTVLANYFDKDAIAYSFVSLPQRKIVLEELTINTNHNLNLDLVLPNKWITYSPKDEHLTASRGRAYNKSNTEIFVNCLYDKLYKNSATSIIIEPNFFEKATSFTEKTAMAVYSGHFMIWPGGWKTPDSMKLIGLDVFDDVIDHSYQYIEHPGERVIQAITRNLDFLQDIEKQQQTRLQLKDRLIKNFEFLRNVNRVKEKLKSLNDKYTKSET